MFVFHRMLNDDFINNMYANIFWPSNVNCKHVTFKRLWQPLSVSHYFSLCVSCKYVCMWNISPQTSIASKYIISFIIRFLYAWKWSNGGENASFFFHFASAKTTKILNKIKITWNILISIPSKLEISFSYKIFCLYTTKVWKLIHFKN